MWKLANKNWEGVDVEWQNIRFNISYLHPSLPAITMTTDPPYPISYKRVDNFNIKKVADILNKSLNFNIKIEQGSRQYKNFNIKAITDVLNKSLDFNIKTSVGIIRTLDFIIKLSQGVTRPILTWENVNKEWQNMDDRKWLEGHSIKLINDVINSTTDVGININQGVTKKAFKGTYFISPSQPSNYMQNYYSIDVEYGVINKKLNFPIEFEIEGIRGRLLFRAREMSR